MKQKWLSTCLLVGLFFGMTAVAAAQEAVKIGVLAKNGPAKALSKWKATGDFLTASLPDHQWH